MDEAHNSAYSIHPGSTKMYMDLKQKYWWNGMKADIARFVAHCDTCQRIKAEHQKPAGLLQPSPIPVWKWDEIGMDFVVGLPKTQKGHDSIWVIVGPLIYSQTLGTRKCPSKFWIQWSKEQEHQKYGCAKSNGADTE
jgi:hypothetical protein